MAISPSSPARSGLAVAAGDIVIIPAEVAHKFTNDGPGRSKLVCIHASPTFIGEWLE